MEAGRGPGPPSRQAGQPTPTACRCMGARRSSGLELSARVPRTAPTQARTRPVQASSSAHRTGHGLPLRALTGSVVGRAALGAVSGLAEEGRAVLEHGVDLPPLTVGCALDPELVLLRVATGGAALVDGGEPHAGEAGLLGVDAVG